MNKIRTGIYEIGNKGKAIRRRITLVVLLLSLAGLSCYANPTDADLDRVKAVFLRSRFMAPFDQSRRDLSDMQLFMLSCRASRVNCGPILKQLQKSDPDFYDRLRKGDRIEDLKEKSASGAKSKGKRS